MNKELIRQAFIKLIAGFVLMGLLIFLPAGSLKYAKGWLLMLVLFVPMLLAGLLMLKYDPELLRKRLNAKETEGEQKKVIGFSGLMFIACFVIAGLNYRFKWLEMPDTASWIACGIFLLGYGMFGEVLRENSYLSRTIEVQSGQKVIDTGLYGIVRHPMYSATIFMFLAMPLILGSPWSFIIMLAYLPLIHARMVNEEKVLAEGLPGYSEYLKKVKWRVIPYLW